MKKIKTFSVKDSTGAYDLFEDHGIWTKRIGHGRTLAEAKQNAKEKQTYLLTCRNCQKNYTGHMGGHPDSTAQNDLLYCSDTCEEEDFEKKIFNKNGLIMYI